MSSDPFNQFLLEQARSVLEANPAGLLVTYGADGFPNARWCCACASQDLTRFYFLTRLNTRKLRDIEARAECTWVFSSPGQEDVVTLAGHARPLASFLSVDTDWAKLLTTLQRYEVGPAAKGNQSFQFMVGVEVLVKKLEIISPRLKIDVSIPIALVPMHDDATIAPPAEPLPIHH